MKRGDIYYADLSPVRGSEQGGIRPVLIIQNDMGNKYSPTTIVACLTTKCTEKHKLPTHIVLDKSCGLPKDSMALLEQIRTIDKERLINGVGRISDDDMKKINKALMISLGI